MLEFQLHHFSSLIGLITINKILTENLKSLTGWNHNNNLPDLQNTPSASYQMQLVYAQWLCCRSHITATKTKTLTYLNKQWLIKFQQSFLLFEIMTWNGTYCKKKNMTALDKILFLTHCSLETPKRVIDKQCRPRSDAAECGIWSRSPLFANSSTIFL